MVRRRIERLIGIVATGLIAVAAAPAVADAATLDTATATGASRPGTPTLGTVAGIAIDAHSGPGGADPAGSVAFDVYINRITHLEPFPLHFDGPVTCLSVSGNRALLNFESGGYAVTVELVDNGGDGNDGFDLTTGNAAGDCTAPGDGYFEVAYDRTLGDGRAIVHDAPPETTITRGPTGPIERKRARFAFTSTDPGSAFQCRLDGAEFSACASPTVLRHLDPGRHRFRVRAIDPAGTVDPDAAMARFRVTRRGRSRNGPIVAPPSR